MTVKASKGQKNLTYFACLHSSVKAIDQWIITDAVDIFTSGCCSHALGHPYYVNMRRA